MKRLTCQCRRAVTQVAKPLENKPTKMLTWHHVNRPDRERRERRSRRSRRLIESTRKGGAGFNAREREREDEEAFVFFELKPL